MTNNIPGPKAPQGRPKAANDARRDERLAAALRANLQRRKAQARARTAEDETGDEAEGHE